MAVTSPDYYMKKVRIEILIVLFILVFSLQSAPVATESLLQPNALSSGQIGGIQYSHGMVNYADSGNFTYTANSTATETFSQSNLGTAPIPLIKDFTVHDVWYRLEMSNYSSTANTSQELRVNQVQLGQLVSWINYTAPLTLDPVLATGRSLMQWNTTNDVELVNAKVKTTDGRVLGEFPQNTTLTEYLYKDNTGSMVKTVIYLVPSIIILDVITQTFQLDYNQTISAFGYMGFYSQYSMNYSITGSAYQVNVTDGQNFAVGVTMFDRIQADYTQFITSYFGYWFASTVTTQLAFANGTKVEDKGWAYPFDLMPVSYTASGSKVEAGFTKVSSVIASTYQGVVAAFVSRANNTSPGSVDLSAQLAAWGLSTSTSLIAYQDGNGNGRLDLNAGRDGLQVDTADQIATVGLAEAYETNITNAYYLSEQYNESTIYWGLGVNDTKTGVNNTQLVINQESYGFGNVDSSTGLTVTWNDPVVQSDGTVLFDFAGNYNNFPVT